MAGRATPATAIELKLTPPILIKNLSEIESNNEFTTREKNNHSFNLNPLNETFLLEDKNSKNATLVPLKIKTLEWHGWLGTPGPARPECL
jgi:hypothetical protein